MKGRKFFLGVFVILMIFVGYRLISKNFGPKVEKKERIIPVLTAHPVKGIIEEKLTLTGDIKGETEVAVRPKTIGRVEEIYVKEGDYVKKGAKLLSYLAGITPDNELYEDLVTFAPISGIVGMQHVKIGEQITSQPGGISPVFTIYKIDNLKVYVDVPENYYGKIRLNMPVAIKVAAFPDEEFPGRMGNIRPVIDPLSRTGQVEILIPNPGYQIKPGMFSEVTFSLRKKENVLLIPADAVLGDAEKFVFVVLNNLVVKKPVEIGLKEDSRLEVTAGLSETDSVITVGQRIVEENALVEVKTND